MEPPYYRLFKDAYSLDRHPLALGYLAATVTDRTDWDVLSYNADFRPGGEDLSYGYLAGEGFDNFLENLRSGTGPVWREIEATLEAERPAVLGLSAASQNFTPALRVARIAKSIDPGVVVVLGGPHASMAALEAMRNPELDICVVGEGEETVVDLLGALDGRRSLAGIPGLVVRRDGQPVATGPRALIEDLDALRFPHQHAPETLKDHDHYPPAAFSRIFATRGCPFNCFFCGSREIWTRRTRFRSVPNVIAEIQGLRSRGIEYVHFDDDTFGVRRSYLLDLCDAMGRDCPGLEWGCEIHVRLVDEEIIGAMKAAGCRRISLGIESGNDEILVAIRKGFTFRRAIEACRVISRHGIALNVFMIIGFPQDTETTILDTIRAARRIDCDKVIFSVFTPYPGTEAFRYCLERGLLTDDFDVALYNHQSPENCFCEHIAPERFGGLVVRTARTFDRINRRRRLRKLFSRRTISRVAGLGIRESLRRGKRIVLHR